ncbi:MAG: lipocalin-like domain-containing protein [Burkholderiales bacterium]
MRRRIFLALPLLATVQAYGGPKAHPTVDYPAAVPGRRLRFPRDHGAHPDYRTEWWYATGWLERGGAPLGFQVTFFRARTPWRIEDGGSFAPRQIVLAHAALADPGLGRLRHDQRAAREAFGLAGAAEATTDAWIDDWRLRLEGNTYRAVIAARDFTLDLALAAEGAPLLQGVAGYSRKGLRPGEASYYYSQPQLVVEGTVDGKPVRGRAWLDHEWSSQYLAREAAGWDWCGINLAAGGALMAFRMRAKAGGVFYAPKGVAFEPLRAWRSPRTGIEYPVAMRVRTRDGMWDLEPLMDDQELDARASTGNVYWEGAVRAMQAGREAGRGYLELTGYGEPMAM